MENKKRREIDGSERQRGGKIEAGKEGEKGKEGWCLEVKGREEKGGD